MDEKRAPGTPGLAVLWISGDPEAGRLMALMYAKNAALNGWWDKVSLILWGPAARLVSRDAALQAELAACAAAGVRLLACKKCADTYGVGADLERLGVEVVYMGEPLTRLLKTGWKVLSV